MWRTLWKELKYYKVILEIRTNLKIETLYFLWFNVSRILFVTFYSIFQNYYLFHLVQCFKTFPLSHTHKTLCISIHHFHFYSFTYTWPQPLMSSHLKYTQTKNDIIYLQPLVVMDTKWSVYNSNCINLLSWPYYIKKITLFIPKCWSFKENSTF